MPLTKSLTKALAGAHAYIFDMDGTIVNLEELNLTAFQQVVSEELNRELTNDEFQTHISGRGSLTGLQTYLAAIDVDTSLAKSLQEKYRAIKRDSLKNRFNEVVKVIAGADDFLAFLVRQKKKTCLATSTGSEFADAILTGTGLKQYFEIIFTREDVQKIKPDPEIFLTAMNQLESSPHETIIFEDSPNGILAAKNSQAFCAGVLNPGFNDEYVERADAVIKDFVEMYRYLLETEAGESTYVRPKEED